MTERNRIDNVELTIKIQSTQQEQQQQQTRNYIEIFNE